MNNNQSYGSYLDHFCTGRAIEVLDDNKIFRTSDFDPDGLTRDQRLSLLEVAYGYGKRSFSDLMPAPDREIELRRWLTFAMDRVEAQLKFIREEFDRYVWFDSPTIPLCQALYDYRYIEDEDSEIPNIHDYDELLMVIYNAFACGLASASGLTSQNVNWEDAKL